MVVQQAREHLAQGMAMCEGLHLLAFSLCAPSPQSASPPNQSKLLGITFLQLVAYPSL